MRTSRLRVIVTTIVALFIYTHAKAQLLDSLALDSLKPYTSLLEALKTPENVIKLDLRKQKLL